MQSYRYKAMTSDGTIVTGRMQAADFSDLEARLSRIGLDFIDARASLRRLPFRRTVPRRELIQFCFHLEESLAAGVPIVTALADLRDSTDDTDFQTVLAAMVESIEGGACLSAAMAAHRRTFNVVVVSLVRAGEASGKLGESLNGLVASLKWQDELAAQARRLALYPSVLLAVTLCLIVFVAAYLVPQLSGFLRSVGHTPPWHTRVLMACSQFLVDYWIVLLAGPVLASAAVAIAFARSHRVRKRWDAYKLHIPFLGNVLRKAALARFAGVLALLYRAGVPILDAMRTTEATVGNAAISRGVSDAGQLISEGQGIAAAFSQTGLFPPLVIRMLAVGESTGAIDRALGNVAYFFDRDVRDAVSSAQVMIEPAIIVVVGLVVGWVMLSVLGPVYDMVGRLGV